MVEQGKEHIKQKKLVQSDNAIRGARIGVFEYDPLSQTVSASEIWREMLEVAPDEVVDIQLEWGSRVHPEDLEAALEPVRLCSEGKTERARCEYRLHSRDRSHWRWLRTDIAVAERDASGKPSLLVGAQTDITERKAMDEALRISIEQFQSAFDNAPIGMAVVGLDGGWLKVNSALCDLLGFSEEELLRTNFQTLTHADDLSGDIELMKALLRGETRFYTMEKRYFRSNGAIMWGTLSVGLVRNGDGTPAHFVSQIVDITEQRRLDQMRNEFVSVVSHELRTPLTSVLGALTLLELDDEAEFSDETLRLLFIAKSNGERLNHLINDILDFQKFSARQMRFSLAQHLVVNLVEESLLTNLASADKYGLRFVAVCSDRSLRGLLDPHRFHQVMANLLSNAAKFSRPGSDVEVATMQLAEFIKISISNNGPGISEAFRDRVFKPFSQASSMSDLRSGGTGLGLSISKKIVEQLGGKIGFESIPNERTTFWFTVRSASLAP